MAKAKAKSIKVTRVKSTSGRLESQQACVAG
jgi:ribosomal protein L30/L7E